MVQDVTFAGGIKVQRGYLGGVQDGVFLLKCQVTHVLLFITFAMKEINLCEFLEGTDA